MTYGTEIFGYEGNQIWNTIPTKIQNDSDFNIYWKNIYQKIISYVTAMCVNYIYQILGT